MKSAREMLEDRGYEDVVIFKNPSYDSALIGVSHDNRAVYDYDLMVKYLIDTEDMSYEEAEDFISYNTIRALPYVDGSPVVVYNVSEV